MFIIIYLFVSKILFSSVDGGDMEPFIIGGDYASISKYPHSVYLKMKCSNIDFTCGSSLLNQQVLLTAGHCLSDCDRGWRIDSYAGDENIYKMRATRKVTRFIVHHDYDEQTVCNDIALAFVNQQFPLGKLIKRVILRTTFSVRSNARVAGWGVIDDYTQQDTDRLKEVQQRIKSWNACSRLGDISGGMMCASCTNSDYARPAFGDSGSALITDNNEQVGIVSFREESHPLLVIYTNVTYYLPWIKNKSKLLFCS